MPTSPVDHAAPDRLLVWLNGEGAPSRWLRLTDGRVVSGGEGIPDDIAMPVILIPPGTDMTVRWLRLDEMPARQAVAAARFQLADLPVAGWDSQHLVIGPAQGGLRPLGLVDSSRFEMWLNEALQAGLSVCAVVPPSLLLVEPDSGLARRDDGPVAHFRGPGEAFSIEGHLADLLVAGRQVDIIDDAAFEERLAAAISPIGLDFLQGRFSRRLGWLENGARRLLLLALALALITAAVQIALILTYTFAADRAEREAASLGEGTSRLREGAGFADLSDALIGAVRDTPSAELATLDYRGHALRVTARADNAALLNGLVARLRSQGARVDQLPATGQGDRSALVLVIR